MASIEELYKKTEFAGFTPTKKYSDITDRK